MKADRQLGWLRASVARLAASLAALMLLGLYVSAPASAQVYFTRAWGSGVLDGASQFETCSTACRSGIASAGAGGLDAPEGDAVDGSGDVFVAGGSNARVDEFSSSGAFIKAWGWGVADGQSQLETCTSTCQSGGIRGGGAGQFFGPSGVAVDGSGDVFITDPSDQRVDEFSSSGAFIKAWGWGVLDSSSQFETCTTTCEAGIEGSGAGQLNYPYTVAVDGSGDVFVLDTGNYRVDEFSSSGAFIRAWGWGVRDGASQLETCTTTCEGGLSGGGAGELEGADGIAVDGSGDVFVADTANERIDEFSSAGAFVRAWDWGVLDGKSQFETCTTTCEGGLSGGGAGQFSNLYGVAVDRSGDVFVTETGNSRVDEFSSSGAFIKAWGWGVADGQSQLETCTSTCQEGSEGYSAGQLTSPVGVAVDGAGDAFVVDTSGDRVDEFGPTPPPQDTLTVSLGGPGSGSVTSSPAGISCPGTCAGQFAGGSQVDLSAVPATGSTFAGWSGGGCSGTGTCTVTMSSDQMVSATFNASAAGGPSGGGGPAAPVNTARPVITGTPRAGMTFSCALGGWSNDPTSVTYQWYRNGTLLAGFTGSTYTLGTLDEGTTIACVVTATNPAGSASAQSNGVKVPVPFVAHCPAAAGTMTGTTIGQASLGMTRARARYLYRKHSDRGKKYEDFFCLTPIGVRVGYASPLLLKALSPTERARVTGRVVWSSTSNPYYSLDGIRPGESIITAAAVLHTEPPFHIGLNYWYLARKPGYTAVLKVRGTVVQELGIATNTLTTTRAQQSVLMHSFY